MSAGQDFESAYSNRLKISLISIISIFIAVFYFYPRLSSEFKDNTIVKIPVITVLEIPLTAQPIKKKIADPPKYFMPAESYEEELLDSVLLAELEQPPYADTSSLNNLYFKYQNSLVQIKEFNPDSIRKMNTGPMYQYKEYLQAKLDYIYKADYSSDSVFFDEHLHREMGRPEGMISLPIPPLISKVSTLFKSKKKKGSIELENIIECESKLYILSALWHKNPQTVHELFKDSEICKKNTINTLQESLELLTENGFISGQVIYKRETAYAPVYSADEIIDYVSRFLILNKGDNSIADTLKSVLNFLIQFV